MYTKKALIATLSAIAAIIILISNYRLLIFNEGYYHEQFSKTGTYERVENADEITHGIIEYINGKRDQLNPDVFNPREISHMKDVKKIVNNAHIFLYIMILIESTLLGLLYVRSKKEFQRTVLLALQFSGIIIILFSAALFIISGLFPYMFEWFHRLLFDQGTYVFSENDMLIKLFPEEFFFHFAFDTLKGSVMASLFILAACLAKEKIFKE